jgi:transcriptional regulator with XRE-family HTH domain
MTARTEKEGAAERLFAIMKERDISPALLAERSGVAKSVIGRIRSDNRDFRFSTAIKLAKGLRVSLDTLAGKEVLTQQQLDRARTLAARLDDVLWNER